MSVGPFGSGSFGTGIFSNIPFYDTKTLIDAVLRNTGHSNPTTETAKRASVLDFINNRYSVISTSQDWDWLYQEVDTLFKEPYQTGTVNLTKGSQSIVGVGTVWSANIVPNNVLSIPSRNETYHISDVTSNTAITTEGQFAGEDALDVAYKIIKPYYTMPSDLETVQSIELDGFINLVPLGRKEFSRVKQTFPGQIGIPRIFTEVGRNSQNGERIIEIYPSPDKNYTARLKYGVNVMRLSDTDGNYPLIPDRHRAVLYYGALSDMYAYMRDSTMADRNESLFQLATLNMRNDTKITDSKITFQTKRNYKNRGSRRKYSMRRSYSISDFANEE